MSRRLFFALWPDDNVRQQLTQIKNKAGQCHQGKTMQPANLHLTLVFLGNVNQQQYDCIVDQAEQITFSPFDLCLGHIAAFQKAKVLWLGLQERPDALMLLAESLHQQAADCGIQLDNKPFNPHVTLMRKVSRLHKMEIEPVSWSVDHFCLVESHTYPEGVQYKVIKTWQETP